MDDLFALIFDWCVSAAEDMVAPSADPFLQVDFGEQLPSLANEIWAYAQEQPPGFLSNAISWLASVPFGKLVAIAEGLSEDRRAESPQAVHVAKSFLMRLHSQVHNTLRRPGDPEGRTVPSYLSLRKAEDITPFLPCRVSPFRTGQRPLPGVDLELVQLLGVGGFGEVWKARNPLAPNAEAVALKFCLDPRAATLLRHEATILNRIMQNDDHPGIVKLRHTFLSSSPPCLEYELVEGGDLAGLILEWHASKKSPSPTDVVRVVLRIAEIVAFAHSRTPPIVHRDLKPTNVLLQKGKRGGVKFRITDFGIGSVATSTVNGRSFLGTALSARMPTMLRGSHTPLYASPQQSLGVNPSPADDVFSLGVLWYQMLTGNLEVGAPSGLQWSRKLQQEGVPKSHVMLLAECLEPLANDRIRTAIQLVDRIRSFLLGQTEELLPKSEPPLDKNGRESSPTASVTSLSPAAIAMHRVRLRNMVSHLSKAYDRLWWPKQRWMAWIWSNLLGFVVCIVIGLCGAAATSGPGVPLGVGIFFLFFAIAGWVGTVALYFWWLSCDLQNATDRVNQIVRKIIAEYPEDIRLLGGDSILDDPGTVSSLLGRL